MIRRAISHLEEGRGDTPDLAGNEHPFLNILPRPRFTPSFRKSLQGSNAPKKSSPRMKASFGRRNGCEIKFSMTPSPSFAGMTGESMPDAERDSSREATKGTVDMACPP
jgi:hypothetical protein